MIVTITTSDIILGLVSTGVLLSVIAWLSKQWIGARIDSSIQHHYAKELEDYKSSRSRREKAELVARLFSAWTKYRGRETNILSADALIERYEVLNRMSLELSLWVEDVELLNDIMTRLQNADNAKSIRTLIGQVRKLILEKNDVFDPQNIVLWPTDDEVDKIFGTTPE